MNTALTRFEDSLPNLYGVYIKWKNINNGQIPSQSAGLESFCRDLRLCFPEQTDEIDISIRPRSQTDSFERADIEFSRILSTESILEKTMRKYGDSISFTTGLQKKEITPEFDQESTLDLDEDDRYSVESFWLEHITAGGEIDEPTCLTLNTITGGYMRLGEFFSPSTNRENYTPAIDWLQRTMEIFRNRSHIEFSNLLYEALHEVPMQEHHRRMLFFRLITVAIGHQKQSWGGGSLQTWLKSEAGNSPRSTRLYRLLTAMENRTSKKSEVPAEILKTLPMSLHGVFDEPLPESCFELLEHAIEVILSLFHVEWDLSGDQIKDLYPWKSLPEDLPSLSVTTPIAFDPLCGDGLFLAISKLEHYTGESNTGSDHSTVSFFGNCLHPWQKAMTESALGLVDILTAQNSVSHSIITLTDPREVQHWADYLPPACEPVTILSDARETRWLRHHLENHPDPDAFDILDEKMAELSRRVNIANVIL